MVRILFDIHLDGCFRSFLLEHDVPDVEGTVGFGHEEHIRPLRAPDGVQWIDVVISIEQKYMYCMYRFKINPSSAIFCMRQTEEVLCQINRVYILGGGPEG